MACAQGSPSSCMCAVPLSCLAAPPAGTPRDQQPTSRLSRQGSNMAVPVSPAASWHQLSAASMQCRQGRGWRLLPHNLGQAGRA